MDLDEKYISQQRYVLDYFIAHSSQRLTTFNFYLLILSFLSTAFGYSFRYSPLVSDCIKVVTSLLLLMLSITFYFLDKRCKLMIKYSEGILRNIEPLILTNTDCKEPIHIFNYEEMMTTSLKDNNKSISLCKFFKKNYSYSDCFLFVFSAGGLLGLFGFMNSVIKMAFNG